MICLQLVSEHFYIILLVTQKIYTIQPSWNKQVSYILYVLDPVFSSRVPSSVGINTNETPTFFGGDSVASSVPRTRTQTSINSGTHHLGTTTKNLYSGYMYVNNNELTFSSLESVSSLGVDSFWSYL